MSAEQCADGSRGKEQAEEALLTIYGRLAAKAARRFRLRVPSFTKDDAYSCAMIGLLKAIRAYDHRDGNRFETFAFAKITGEILEALRNDTNSSLWHSPGRKTLSRISEAHRTLSEAHGRPATNEEVSAATGIEVMTVAACFEGAAVQHMTPFTEGTSLTSSSELYEDPAQIACGELAINWRGKCYNISEAFACLNARQWHCFSEVVIHEVEQKSVALEMGVSRGRVSQILDGCAYKLRKYLALLEGQQGP